MLKRAFRQISMCILLGGMLVGLQLTQISRVNAQQRLTHISTQKFERGSMIWRGDNGDIWVLLDSGSRAYKFGSAIYSSLPQNTTLTPPASLIKPLFGFGAIWANFAWVRSALGWAMLPEVGYLASLNDTRTLIKIARLDNQLTAISLQGGVYSWRLVPLNEMTERQTTYAAFQEFENGYLIWRADTQDVVILYGKTGGTYDGSSVSVYGKLPNNPVTDAPPSGRIKPINAFGRVWSNLWLHNDRRLGWAISPEQGFSAIISELPIEADSRTLRTTITLPNGRTVVLADNFAFIYWYFQS